MSAVLFKRVLEKAGLKMLRAEALDELWAAAKAANPPTLLQPYDPPVLPRKMRVLCELHDSLAPEKRDEFSRSVMTRATQEPGHFQFMGQLQHPLALQTSAAAEFAKGNLTKAAEIFARLASEAPDEFNALCLARTYEAAGDFSSAGAVLKERLDRNELFIVMELATLRAQQGNISAANALLTSVSHHFEDEQRAIMPLQAELDNAIAAGLMEKKVSDDIYTDDFVTESWWFYLWTYNTFNEFQHGNPALETGIRRQVSKLLKQSQTKTFIDFGAFCGFTIAKLAEEFPHIRFVGIDRPKVAKKLNDEWFSAPNLEFHATDIMTYLNREKIGPDTVLFHSRTAVFCYPAFLSALYDKCHTLGIRDIIMQEGSAVFSRSHMRFFAPGQYPAISVAGRGSTFMHDYQTILERAGYSIKSNEPIRPKLLLDDRSGFGAHHTVLHAQC